MMVMMMMQITIWSSFVSDNWICSMRSFVC